MKGVHSIINLRANFKILITGFLLFSDVDYVELQG